MYRYSDMIWHYGSAQLLDVANALFDILFIIVTCSAGVRQVTSCLQTVLQIPINCPNDKMIHVTLAFHGRTKNKQYEEFCSGPYSSTDDCRRFG